jgi:isochorismate synthase
LSRPLQSHRTGGFSELGELADAGKPVFEEPDVQFAGSGEIERIDTPSNHDLRTRLETIQDRLNAYGPDALAFVSTSFASNGEIVALVPETIFTVDPAIATPSAAGPPSEIPTSFDVRCSRSPKSWCGAVEDAVEMIAKTDLEKVVLAREVVVEADQPFKLGSALDYLRGSYPTSYRFAVDGLVGASPELLIQQHGTTVASKPMAGTLGRQADATSDAAAIEELLASAKNQGEHGFLSRYVRDTLSQFSTNVQMSDVPEVLSLANVHHLTTPVTAKLSSSTSISQLLAALHPTPAIAGWPTPRALEAIEALEELDRGRYGGAVGWMRANGDGCFAIALRCAQVDGMSARLFAGNGIVGQSSPAQELLETRWKLQPMLNALVRP